MPIEGFSIKTRGGFARAEPKDDAVEAWAGFIPYATTTGTPVPDAVTGTRFPAPGSRPPGPHPTARMSTEPAGRPVKDGQPCWPGL
ncbi:hypothetical protein [Streptomyces sp. NBC_00503]|uniref:hypothetical protein n=1 Tax=Streptomyces sp. NBC_00503 TaxID=2903659 RepID=UPI002E81B684|nr:hypothetical protein [Streptomyces sp. NBC_00503]WUD82538.1 hypothetical protein OG490_19435 [Streptomyces sp. NBC_00503]